MLAPILFETKYRSHLLDDLYKVLEDQILLLNQRQLHSRWEVRKDHSHRCHWVIEGKWLLKTSLISQKPLPLIKNRKIIPSSNFILRFLILKYLIALQNSTKYFIKQTNQVWRLWQLRVRQLKQNLKHKCNNKLFLYLKRVRFSNRRIAFPERERVCSKWKKLLKVYHINNLCKLALVSH